jgi:hypothetical protein
MAWLAVLGTLLGTIIGAIATLLAQQISARAADKRERLQQRAAFRAEYKNQIEAFIEATQEVERVAGDPDQFEYSEKTKVHTRFWIQHKRLALICSDELARPLDELADTLNRVLWGGAPDGIPVWKYIASASWKFRKVARDEIRWTEQT